MSDEATLKQAKKVLELIVQSGRSSEELQALLSSGFFTDLLDADISEVPRDEFRKAIGLISATMVICLGDYRVFQPPTSNSGFSFCTNRQSPIGRLKIRLLAPFSANDEGLTAEDLWMRYGAHPSVLGENHALAMLEAQRRIPRNWEPAVVFPATVVQDARERRYIPEICGHDGRWRFEYLPFGTKLDMRTRVACLVEDASR